MSETKEYMFEYRYEGETFVTFVPADSMAEAKARLSAMALGNCKGVVHGKVAVGPFSWVSSLFGIRP